MGFISLMTVIANTLSRGALAAGVFGIFLMVGCSGPCPKPSPSKVTGIDSTAAETISSRNASSPAQEESKRRPDGEVSRTTTEPTEGVSKPDKRVSDSEPVGSIAKLESSPVKSAAPSPVLPPSAPKIPSHRVEKQAEPPLDLALLEKRLKETSAIGVFTKLALKNQVDDLLDDFRAYYQGRSSTSLAQLRQPYEMLIMKVLALLQDSDPQLARDLLDSREAIWQVLADPEKFAAL